MCYSLEIEGLTIPEFPTRDVYVRDDYRPTDMHWHIQYMKLLWFTCRLTIRYTVSLDVHYYYLIRYIIGECPEQDL